MSGYRAVVFDLDGTLIDSAPAMQNIANSFLADLDAAPITLEEARAFIGDGARVFCRRLLETRALPHDEAALDAAYERYLALYAAAPPEENVPFPGAFELLAELTEAGVPVGLCTNKPGAPTCNVLSAFRLAGVFGAVVAGDTLATKKPDPEPLLHVIRALGAEPAATLYVGDSEVDAATAIAARVDFALFEAGYARVPTADIFARFTFADFAELKAIALGTAAA